MWARGLQRQSGTQEAGHYSTLFSTDLRLRYGTAMSTAAEGIAGAKRGQSTCIGTSSRRAKAAASMEWILEELEELPRLYVTVYANSINSTIAMSSSISNQNYY